MLFTKPLVIICVQCTIYIVYVNWNIVIVIVTLFWYTTLWSPLSHPVTYMKFSLITIYTHSLFNKYIYSDYALWTLFY